MGQALQQEGITAIPQGQFLTGIRTTAMRALQMQQRKEEGFPGTAAEVIRSEWSTAVPALSSGGARFQRGSQVPVLISGKKLCPSSLVIKK